MARVAGARLVGSVLAVAPWLLALLGALLLTQELSPTKAGTLGPSKAQEEPKTPPSHKEEVVFQPWEHVQT